MIWSSGSTIVGGAALAPAGVPETLVITPDAHATLATAGDARLIHGTLVNYGTVAHSEGGRVWALNAVFDNRTGGMYSVLRGDITDSNWPPGKAGIFNNAGTLLKQGSGEYRMAARLTNAGLIQVLTGTLRLEDGVVARPIVTHTGSFVVAPAGTLLFDNLKSDFGVTSSFNVSGTLGLTTAQPVSCVAGLPRRAWLRPAWRRCSSSGRLARRRWRG